MGRSSSSGVRCLRRVLSDRLAFQLGLQGLFGLRLLLGMAAPAPDQDGSASGSCDEAGE